MLNLKGKRYSANHCPGHLNLWGENGEVRYQPETILCDASLAKKPCSGTMQTLHCRWLSCSTGTKHLSARTGGQNKGEHRCWLFPDLTSMRKAFKLNPKRG
jgi:hypothetical protein